MIKNCKCEVLMVYVCVCVDCVYVVFCGFDIGVIFIVMIEGSVLGGGFEVVLVYYFVLV